MPTIQPLHRHADMRLVVFTSGTYRERSFERGAVFTPGDFVIRPRFLAHDGFALRPPRSRRFSGAAARFLRSGRQ